MKRTNPMICTAIFIAILLLSPTRAIGQNSGLYKMRNTQEHIIKSGANNKSYALRVSLPNNYSTADSLHYPVLYVLDGKFSFTSFYAIRQNLDLGREIVDLIIVAIDDSSETDTEWLANRYNDYTPSSITQADSMWSKIMNIPPGKLKSGGAKMFLNTLKDDIIPFIDQQYRTTYDRGLSGHSLGGLFVGYCILKAPGLFKNYALNSPSFWWNNNEMLSTENSFSKQNGTLSANIFISAGELEGIPMISPVTDFEKSLKGHNYKGLTLTSQIFAGETHLSVVPASSSRTLKVLYGSNVK